LIYLDLLGFGTTCFEEAELGGLSEEREVRYADHLMKGEKKYPTSDGFGWVRMGSDGFGWVRMGSDGFGWVRMALGGLGWPQLDSEYLG
jgi:hypothetical protein